MRLPTNRALPQYCPSASVADDLELMRMDVLSARFAEPPGFSQLYVPSDLAGQARDAGAIELTDPEGAKLAEVSIDDTYSVTDDIAGIIGRAHDVTSAGSRPFNHLYRDPVDIHKSIGRETLTVPVTAPLSEDAVREIGESAGDRTVLLLALTGDGSPGKISPTGLIRASIAASRLLPDAHVIAVPAASRGETSASPDFYAHVAEAYAPGEILWVTNTGPLPPPIAETVRRDRPEGTAQGVVVFLTGLSGSGKSTIAQRLRDRILETGERTVSLLDGDRVRRHLSRGLGFSKQDRELNIERIGWVAAEIASHGGLAICSPIAPFDHTRKAARSMAQTDGAAFVLVHVSTPLAECERRDRKGLYAKARRGEIEEFTGISSPYEEPSDAELSIDTTELAVNDAVDQILRHLASNGWITSAQHPSDGHA